MSRDPIKRFRAQIDAFDEQIVQLISRRGRVAQKIGDLKRTQGMKVYAPAREAQIFAKLAALNTGPYTDQAIRSIYREIISATRSLEEPLNIAYLGPETTFTHQAAMHHFGAMVHYVPQTTIARVIHAVHVSEVDFGVVAIENSTAGVVVDTLDALLAAKVDIVAKFELPIDLQLISVEGNAKAVTDIYSYSMAFAQCKQWLADHFPRAHLHEVPSTAQAVELASRKRRAAAVASRMSADMYGLNILFKNIQDHDNNRTRFIVIGPESHHQRKEQFASYAFATKNIPGSLSRVLQAFARCKINILQLVQRPANGQTWDSVFLVECEIGNRHKQLAKLADGLSQHTVWVRSLGTYPLLDKYVDV